MSNNIYRVIDANINRLMEGLRVVEEICRFELDNAKLTEEIKTIRAKVKYASQNINNSKDRFLASRDSAKDVGRKLYPKSEGSRKTLEEVLNANMSRSQEAARVLEEFTKLIDSNIGKSFKEIRYSLYDVEKLLAVRSSQLAVRLKLDFDLYVVTDPDVLGKKSPVTAVKEVIKGGCKMIQLRDKKASIGQYYKWAKEISDICKKAGVAFIVNDYLDVCMAVDADGIHLGQDDVPVGVARKLLGSGKLIGLSTHSYDQAMKGMKSGADYISVGPIYKTDSKPGVVPLGLGLLKKICSGGVTPPVRIVAIGGINENNINDILKINPRIAVIRAAIGQKEITRAVKGLRRKFNER